MDSDVGTTTEELVNSRRGIAEPGTGALTETMSFGGQHFVGDSGIDTTKNKLVNNLRTIVISGTADSVECWRRRFRSLVL